jgi:hypothetical protein
MPTQKSLLAEDASTPDTDLIDLGKGLGIRITRGYKAQAQLYRHGTLIKTVYLLDKVAKRIFVVEVVELGAIQSRLADALGITRQTIHNYREIQKHFGVEGLIHGYTVKDTKSKERQKKLHADKRPQGNKAQQVAQIRRQERLEQSSVPETEAINFSVANELLSPLSPEEQPFAQEKDWEPTRYAGVGIYWIALLTHWKWLQLITNHFGNGWRIFAVFLLMASQNIRSIEQLKNVHSREAGRILGLDKIPSKPIVWAWFYEAASRQKAQGLITAYFRHQLQTGLVGLWLWFSDGHLLPYTGKSKIHYAFNTQRRMPVPGRTNQVVTDASGRIVDFEIQEGKGDMKGSLLALRDKWREELPHPPILVFDREGHDGNFFHSLIEQGSPFVTWDKHVDKAKLEEIDDKAYTTDFTFNGKKYGVFEGTKEFKYGDKDDRKSFSIRRIYLWNHSSHRRTCGLAWSDESMELSTQECAEAILSRWGASENAFKHIQERHPFHYHPGFKLVKSDRQDAINPAIKIKQKEIDKIRKTLGRLYKKSVTAQAKNRSEIQREKIQEEINQLQELERKYVEERDALPDKIDVSTLQDYKSFNKIDNEGKYIFDFVTTSVWNARKKMVSWLSEYYGEENDLVDLFYAITSTHGWVKNEKNQVTVRLEPIQQPKRRAAQEQFCRKLNSLGAQLPNGKWIIVEVGDSPI